MLILLDIGCNVLGGFNLLKQFEDITDNTRKIFVEPNPECWPEVEQKLVTIPNSVLVKKAISTTEGMVELITRADVAADIAATILSEEYLKTSLARCNMFVNNYNTYRIESTTIKNILTDYNIAPQDTILKLDIEGMEYDILDNILQHNFLFKKIYCEFHIHNNKDQQKKIFLLNQFSDKNIHIIDWQ